MIFRQFTHEDLGCASYLVGDSDAGLAAVVDPKFDIEPYLQVARYLGVHIDHVIETHNHADHVSGHGRLAAATGATIHVHRLADPAYDHEPFDDGWELELGRLTVRALHTPGHRPEHTAFALIDRGRGDEPWAVLTGDSLFVGAIARPDLAVDKAQGARDIFRSLHGKILALPDTCEVWPGHLGGSLCGGPGMDLKICSTVGFERARQQLLQMTDEEVFVAEPTANLPPQPPNFEAIVAINRGPLLRDSVEVHPLTPRQVGQAQRHGALVVDIRTADKSATAGQNQPPDADRTIVDFPKNLSFDPKAVPNCAGTESQLQNTTTDQAIEVCGKSSIVTVGGTVTVDNSSRSVTSPTGAFVTVASNPAIPGSTQTLVPVQVTGFNGTDNNVLYLHARPTALPVTNVLVGKLVKGKSPYGSSLDVTIPQLLAGGISDFKTTVKNGKYVQAVCKSKKMPYQARTTYSDVPSTTATYNGKCTQKKSKKK